MGRRDLQIRSMMQIFHFVLLAQATGKCASTLTLESWVQDHQVLLTMPKVNTENVLGKPPGAHSVDQDYELGKVLGKGAFGTVRLATSKATGEKLACKSIAKAKLVCREDVQDVQREVAIMNHVAGHPNVVNSKVLDTSKLRVMCKYLALAWILFVEGWVSMQLGTPAT